MLSKVAITTRWRLTCLVIGRSVGQSVGRNKYAIIILTPLLHHGHAQPCKQNGLAAAAKLGREQDAEVLSCCSQARSQKRLRKPATHLHSPNAWRCPQCAAGAKTTGIAQPTQGMLPTPWTQGNPCTHNAPRLSTTYSWTATTVLSICDGKWARDACCQMAPGQTMSPNRHLGCPRD